MAAGKNKQHEAQNGGGGEMQAAAEAAANAVQPGPATPAELIASAFGRVAFSMPDDTAPYVFQNGKQKGTKQYRIAEFALELGHGTGIMLGGWSVVALQAPEVPADADLPLEVRMPKSGAGYSVKNLITLIDSGITPEAWTKFQDELIDKAIEWRNQAGAAPVVTRSTSTVRRKLSALGIK